MEKIIDFFKKKVVIITEVVIMILATVGLFIGGYTSDGIKALIDYVGTFVLAAVTFAKVIKQFISKDK